MRVLILGRSSNSGGGPVHNVTLARGLNSRGHVARIIFTHNGSPSNWMHRQFASEGLVIESLCYRYAERQYLHDLADLIDRERVDALLIDNQERLGELWELSSRLRRRECKVSFICHCHNVPPNLLRQLQPNLHRVICVSQASADLLQEFNPVVIRNAVAAPPETGEDIRARLDIPPDAFVIGYLGRSDQNKRSTDVARAIEGTDWCCVLGGKGAAYPFPEHGADVRDRVRVFSDEIANMGDWLRALDVFVLPSQTEGFPLSVLEAFICGCRVAATRVSDLPTVFGDAIGFFDCGDLDGLRNAVRCAPPAEIGQKIIAEEFTVERFVAQYEEALL